MVGSITFTKKQGKFVQKGDEVDLALILFNHCLTLSFDY